MPPIVTILHGTESQKMLDDLCANGYLPIIVNNHTDLKVQNSTKGK